MGYLFCGIKGFAYKGNSLKNSLMLAVLFKFPNSFKSHVQNTHLRCCYECDSCGYQFAEKLDGLDHIFAVHFESSSVATGALTRSQIKTLDRRTPLYRSAGTKLSASIYSNGCQLNKQNVPTDRLLQINEQQNIAGDRAEGSIIWSDPDSRKNSTALLSYLSVQTQAMDLISQLLWLTALKSNTNDGGCISNVNNNCNSTDEKYGVQEMKLPSAIPPSLPMGRLSCDSPDDIEVSNLW